MKCFIVEIRPITFQIQKEMYLLKKGENVTFIHVITIRQLINILKNIWQYFRSEGLLCIWNKGVLFSLATITGVIVHPSPEKQTQRFMLGSIFP